MNARRSLVLALTASLVAPAAAGAHVAIKPAKAAAGASVEARIHVPNERDGARTTQVRVQLPGGFTAVETARVAGWTITQRRATEGVKEITWTARDGAGIKGRESVDFPISARIPGEAGDRLTFKTLQTYDSGEVVRWIGAADAANPAAVLSVTAGEQEQEQDLHSEQAQEPAQDAPAASPAPAPQADDEDDDDDGSPAVIALIVGGLGLAAGALALIITRRKDSR